METLAAYLIRRAARSFRYLLAQTQGITAEQALRYRDPKWPDQRWGIGQNGSIAGIVYHVAAWKTLTLPIFQPNGKPSGREAFDASLAPAPDDWPGIVAWLTDIGRLWHSELERLPENSLEETWEWEGVTILRADFVLEMLEHDIQHAAQIEYLRQRLWADGLQNG